MLVMCVFALTISGCGAAGPDTIAAAGLPASIAEAPTAAPAPAGPVALADNIDAVDAMLDAISAAFLAADASALRPWLHDPESPFGRRWLQRLQDMREVPFSSYALTVDSSLPDVTSRDLPGQGGLLINVLEDHQLVGMEELGPLRAHLFLTLLERDGRWTVAGDSDAEALGLVSADHLWDNGPVMATRQGALLLLHRPGQGSVDALLQEAQGALATATARWPLAWPGTVPVIVPRDEAELAELLHVTYDLSNFIAFATSSPVGELGALTMSGSRIVLNTNRFLDRSSATRERILVHELVHAASRPSSSPDLPSWVEEGVAQALGEQRSTTGTVLLDSLARTGWDGSLPMDAQFSVGGRDRIFLSYQQSWSFVDYLLDAYGRDAVGAFYLAAGQGSQGDPGTTRARLDVAARAVFGAPVASLVATWRAGL
jgi:hypothetical protein